MKSYKILIIILSIFLIAVAINTVDAAQADNTSEEITASSDAVIIASGDNNGIASSDANAYTSSGKTHTYKATGKSVYIKDYNPKYKLSKKAKKQIKSVKKAPKKTYKLTIDDDTYKSLKYAKKTKTYDFYTFNTNYKCKVLKPVLKTKTIKKTIINKKYTSHQKYDNAYRKYFTKYNSGKYNMKVKFHFYKGTDRIKYATIKVTKKVKVNKTLKLKKVLSLSKKKMKKYDFVSSKTAVATVNENGIVRATKKGKTVITVTSKKTGNVYAKITVKVKNRYNATQLRLMSSIIFCEAGAESYAGKKAVGIVIMNRIKSGSFPNTLAGVIYQRGQFTPAATGFLSRALNKYDNGNIPQACINAAKETLNGNKTVVLGSSETSMANFLFFSRYVAGCRLKIGGHMFK